MRLHDVIHSVKKDLNGRAMSSDDMRTLNQIQNVVAVDWYMSLLKRGPFIGANLALDDDDDQSGMGVEFIWMTPEQTVDEALKAYPGRLVLKLGLLPIGMCAEGTGDPYFLDLRGDFNEDPPLVRVPHDFAGGGDSYPLDKIEKISDHLSEFLRLSKIEDG